MRLVLGATMRSGGIAVEIPGGAALGRFALFDVPVCLRRLIGEVEDGLGNFVCAHLHLFPQGFDYQQLVATVVSHLDRHLAVLTGLKRRAGGARQMSQTLSSYIPLRARLSASQALVRGKKA
jgi:hypothetical protein